MAEQAANPNGTYVGPSGLDGIVRYFSHRRLEKYGAFVTVGVGEGAAAQDFQKAVALHTLPPGSPDVAAQHNEIFARAGAGDAVVADLDAGQPANGKVVFPRRNGVAWNRC